MKSKTWGTIILVECVGGAVCSIVMAFLESESALPWILAAIWWLMFGIATLFFAIEHQSYKDELKDHRNDLVQFLLCCEIMRRVLQQTNEEKED